MLKNVQRLLISNKLLSDDDDDDDDYSHDDDDDDDDEMGRSICNSQLTVYSNIQYLYSNSYHDMYVCWQSK